MHPTKFIRAGLIAALIIATASAADRTIIRNTGVDPVNLSRRVALVIGNGAYQNVAPLQNPVNDARDMAQALTDLDFDVTLGINQTRRQMRRALRTFGQKLKKGGVGLFYYAGHGIQVKGKNYLLPVGADILYEDEVSDTAVEADLVLRKMQSANNGMNFVILDACRNNPFARKWRYAERGLEEGGLSAMPAPSGVIIFYAARPGETAKDGDGRNSPFTHHLLRQLHTPGQEVIRLIRNVAAAVETETEQQQHPWMEGMPPRQNFYIKPLDSTPTPQPTPQNAGNAEAAMWKVVSRSDTIEDYKAFLKAYPDGQYAPAARVRLAQLRLPTPTPSVSPRKKITNSIGMEFVYIPPGEFMMGSPTDEPKRNDDEKQHKVILTQGYYLQTTEVTQRQWRAVMDSDPPELRFKNCGDDCPVENVSWNNVQEFIQKLNQKERTNQYRLPTEAQWEYACRAGTTAPFAFGDCLSTDQANYDGNYPMPNCSKGKYRKKTIPVASFKPNRWGLYDMHGNVWEWCQDWHGDYPSEAVTDPQGAESGSARVVRGGGWGGFAGGCRSAGRNGYDPGGRALILGFRLLRTP